MRRTRENDENRDMNVSRGHEAEVEYISRC